MKFFYSHSEPLVELYFKKIVVSHPKIKTLFFTWTPIPMGLCLLLDFSAWKFKQKKKEKVKWVNATI